MSYAFVGALGLAVVILTFLLLRTRRAVEAVEVERNELQSRYGAIQNVDEAVATAKRERDQVNVDRASGEQAWAEKREQLKTQYATALAKHEALAKDIALLEENLEDISYGLYTPHYSFSTSDEYKAKLESIRAEQKQMVRDGKAAIARRDWQVGGSAAEGKRMTKQYLKVLLRDFNAECDAAVAIVSWNNVTRMEERIQKSFNAINELGTVMEMSIAAPYLRTKLAELRLAYEYEERRYQEREEQRRAREQMREEERVQRELEKAKEEAEKDEARYQKALQKAREEAAQAEGAKLDKLQTQIQGLEAQLLQAQQQKERAVSRAQLTKSGNVYVISNVGSFGERVFKIGMTRRLEPLERVYELGDASVPFPFDVHAMIFSDNAPELERKLHVRFNNARKNWVNPRKEFFEADLDDIETFLQTTGLKADFIRLAEAKEYRETLSLRQKQTAAPVPTEDTEFPKELFADSSEA